MELAPKGKLQAHLRCSAAKEMETHPADYPIGRPVAEYAREVATAGVWAESPALIALAQACNLELRIWAWEASLSRWQLYIVRGPRMKSVKDAKVVWLCLADLHYRWLKPKTAAAHHGGVLAQALKRTVDGKVDPLRGAGRATSSTSSSARVRRILGLDSASSAATASHSVGARTLLGMAPAARSVGARMLLGLAHSTTSNPRERDFEIDLPYRAGDLCVCPCGWRPSEGTKSQKRSTQAKRHWQQCQGTAPPKETTELRRSVGAASSGSAASAEKARRLFSKWLVELRAKNAQVAGAACTPYLEVPFGINARYRYTCTKCGQQRTLTSFRRLPCVARKSAGSTAAAVTRSQWNECVLGRKRTAKIKKSILKCQQLRRQTQSGKEYISKKHKEYYERNKAKVLEKARAYKKRARAKAKAKVKKEVRRRGVSS